MPSRRTGDALTAGVIVERALAIADDDGLGALSMRRLAADLGVTAMAIYRHIADKDALVGLMVEHTLSGLPEPDPAGEWREQMRRFFTITHDLMMAHPAVAQIMAQRPLDGARATGLADRALATLLAAGFDDDLAVEAFVALGGYTLGGSLYQAGRATWVRADARFDGVAALSHPALSRLGAQLARARDEDQFARGLDRLIEGYAQRLAAG